MIVIFLYPLKFHPYIFVYREIKKGRQCLLFKEYVNKKKIIKSFFIIQLKQTNTEQKYKFI